MKEESLMKMKLRMSLLLVLILMVFGAVSFADTDSVVADIEVANATIESLVADAIAQAELLSVEAADDPEEFAQELALLIDELVAEVNEVAFEAMDEAAEMGVTVYCELVEVEICGNTVMIDPLIVGGF